MTEERLAAPRDGAVADVLLSGRYRLGDALGSGSAGHVYRAFDVLLQRDVAVKVLDRLRDDVGIARAVRAARAAARARHERLVEVLDVDRGRPSFVTFGLVSGRPLSEVLAEGQLPCSQALAVADDLLGALAALHQVGAVHRDVSLDNVWLGDDGRAWLTSAGLSEAARDVGLGLRVGADPMCRPSAAPSPEQVLGLPADARSDVAAASGVVHALLAPEPWDRVSQVLDRAANDDPDRRYRDASELRAPLWEAIAPAPSAPPPARPAPPPARPAQPAPPAPAGGAGRRSSALGRFALGVAAVVAAWLLLGEPLMRLGSVGAGERVEQGAPAPQEAETPRVVQPGPPPVQLPADELQRILDSAAGSTVDLGPETVDLLARLRDLDRLRGIARQAEAADLYGRAAVDAAAGTNSAALAAQIAELLRPELSVDGLIGLIDRDPVAVGPLGRTYATRLRVLQTLAGEAREAEAFDLWLTAQTATAEGTLTPEFAASARTVLSQILPR